MKGTTKSGGLMLPSEAADYLATTERHLRRLIADGLRVVQLGGKRRFRREDLDDYVANALASQAGVLVDGVKAKSAAP